MTRIPPTKSHGHLKHPRGFPFAMHGTGDTTHTGTWVAFICEGATACARLQTVHNNFLDWFDTSTPSKHPVFGKVRLENTFL